jgi:hypothetical protein
MSAFHMSAWPYTYALDGVAQKWRALAERRRAHLVELYDSGRWLAERWVDIAPRAADEVFAAQARAVADTARRSAA